MSEGGGGWQGSGGMGLASLFGLDIAGGIASGLQAQKKSNLSTRHAREFALHMSNTQYQRAVRDLKKAGLNPMLAYTQGGASSPTVGAADVPPIDVESAVSGAQHGIAAAKELKLMDANIATARAMQKKVEQEADSAQSMAQADKFEPYIRSLQQDLMNWQILSTEAGVHNTHSATARQILENRLRGYDEQELSMRNQWLKAHPNWYSAEQFGRAMQPGVSSAAQALGAVSIGGAVGKFLRRGSSSADDFGTMRPGNEKR